MRARATVDTQNAERYAAQLCKHFAHKVPAHYENGTGLAQLPMGECRLSAATGVLTLEVEAADAEKLEAARAIVGDHLERFAWREALRVEWALLS